MFKKIRNYKLKKKDAIYYLIVLILVSILIWLALFAYNNREYIKDAFNKADATSDEFNDENLPDLPYVAETKYIGGIGYPQVYEIPFEKSDIYKSNKQLWKDHPDRVPEIVDTAKKFMSHTLNVNYKEIYDYEDYVNGMLTYMDPYWMYEEGNEEANDGIGYFSDEYARMWAERVIDNEITMESDFITDTSLVYVNGLYYVRGILEYTVFSSTDEEIVKSEDKQLAMIEVALHLKTDDNGYEVVYVNPIELPDDIVLTYK